MKKHKLTEATKKLINELIFELESGNVELDDDTTEILRAICRDIYEEGYKEGHNFVCDELIMNL